MKRHNKLLIGSVVLMLGAGSAVGYGVFRDRRQEAERGAYITTMAAGFKERCPPDTSRDQSCFYEPPGLGDAARLHETNGEFAEAGVIYAKLQGRQADATRMVESCEKNGDLEGAERIRLELSSRAKAITRYYGEAQTKTDSPAPSGSRQP